MTTRTPIYPFLVPDDSALDSHYREVLQTITGAVNADSMAANPCLMSDYLVLSRVGMVRLSTQPTVKPYCYRLEIVLTDKAKALASIPTTSPQKPAPRVVGDMVTIIGLRPRVGRSGDTWGHWEGITDDEQCPIIHLYPEDWSAMKKAGYNLPDWNDRARSTDVDSNELIDIVFNRTGFDTKGKPRRPVEASFPCEIDVIPYPEKVNGHWRIAQVMPVQRQWIRVSYTDLGVGDVIQNGTQGDETIVSIGEAYQGTRPGVVEDADGRRDVVFKATLTYTLVKGALLDAARRDGTLVDAYGTWIGKGRLAG